MQEQDMWWLNGLRNDLKEERKVGNEPVWKKCKKGSEDYNYQRFSVIQQNLERNDSRCYL